MFGRSGKHRELLTPNPVCLRHELHGTFAPDRQPKMRVILRTRASGNGKEIYRRWPHILRIDGLKTGTHHALNPRHHAQL